MAVDEYGVDTEDANNDGLGVDTTDTTEDTADAATTAAANSSTAGITPKQMAKNHLRKANKKENTGTITLLGDPGLVSGVTVGLLNFGAFNATHIIAKATHRVSNGYEVEVEIRKCLNGY